MTDSHALAARIPTLVDTRILCVGDLMLDRFVHGKVSRVSPEAPIPVLQVEREASMLGGAGNVVRNVVALGGVACFVAVVGDDPVGRELTAIVGDEPRVEPYLLVERGRPSTLKTRYLAGAQQLLRADTETVRPIAEQTAETLIRLVGEAAPGCDVVVLSDYAKGVLTPAVCAAVIEAARGAGKPVVVDPKGTDFARYRGATAITPNLREAATASGLAAGDDDQVAAIGRALTERLAVEAVLITRSEHGMSLIARDGAAHHLPARAREVFDVSGAGDTAVATFALAVGRGVALDEAADLANHAAGIVVGKVGTAVVYGDDLLRSIHADEWSAAEAKVTSRAGALERVEAWRRKGARIGFTNGCFDLLHPGHVALLDQAKAACDRLVVALNSDPSVARLKGAGRPIQPEASRAQVLASLGSVDLVVVFDEDTPMALIEAIRPDVLVKGADYRRDEVVGAEFVEGYGGKVLLAAVLDGHSTTGTIRKIAR